MQCEGQVPAVWVVPVVLMPCDLIWLQKFCPAQERMLLPELDDFTAAVPGVLVAQAACRYDTTLHYVCSASTYLAHQLQLKSIMHRCVHLNAQVTIAAGHAMQTQQQSRSM